MRITSFRFWEALVEVKYHLLYEVLYFVSLLTLDDDRPIMRVAFCGRFFPPLSRMPQDKLYLHRLGQGKNARLHNYKIGGQTIINQYKRQTSSYGSQY